MRRSDSRPEFAHLLVIVGYLIVVASVFGGFALAGGHLAALFQPLELLMIGGAALGALFVGNNGKAIKATIMALPALLKGSKYTKTLYLELMALLSELLPKVRKEGLMSIEGDIDAPEDSPIFNKYPGIASDHHVMEFITDYLRLMVAGNMDAFQIENLMDNEIETHHHEGEVPVHCIAKLGDGMPAFGIVGGHGRGAYDGIGWPAAVRAGNIDRACAGRHLPRHSACLWFCRSAIEFAGTEAAGVIEDAAVREGDLAR